MNLEILKQHIKENNLTTPCRKREFVYRRYYLYHYLYVMHGFQLVDIGKLFDRDHSTVINGLRMYEDLKNYRDFIELTVDEFEKFPVIENHRDRYTLNRTPIYWTREEYKLILDTRVEKGLETNVEAIKFLINDNIRKD